MLGHEVGEVAFVRSGRNDVFHVPARLPPPRVNSDTRVTRFEVGLQVSRAVGLGVVVGVGHWNAARWFARAGAVCEVEHVAAATDEAVALLDAAIVLHAAVARRPHDDELAFCVTRRFEILVLTKLQEP